MPHRVLGLRAVRRREAERELCFFAQSTFHANLSAVSDDNLVDDREAEPSSAVAPCAWVRKNLSNTRGKNCAGMPSPVSATENWTVPSPAEAFRVMVPPRSVCRSALVIKLSNTCSIRSRSTSTRGNGVSSCV